MNSIIQIVRLGPKYKIVLSCGQSYEVPLATIERQRLFERKPVRCDECPIRPRRKGCTKSERAGTL